MSNAPKSRGIIRYVWNNFMNSLKVAKREKVGNMMGKDPYGNVYYELPAQPELGKRRPTRWYNTAETAKADVVGKDVWAGFDSELPSEWESWLRHRRAQPPSEDEVLQSLAISQLKKINAAKLEEKRRTEMEEAGLDPGPPKPQDHEKTPYPKYDDLELMPGESGNKQFDKWEKYKNPYSKS